MCRSSRAENEILGGVQVLALALIDCLAAVEGACGEALGERVHSADVILNT
jgi:hypothetical protein